MKVLFIGSTDPHACSQFYYTSLLGVGYEVLPFNPRYFEPKGWVDRLTIKWKKGPSQQKVQAVSDALISLCKKHSFDFILVLAENFLGLDTLNEIRAVSKTSPFIVYHSHDNNFSAGILKPDGFWKILKAYDAVFTTKSQNVAKYKALGQAHSYYIPSAYEPSVHRTIPSAESSLGNSSFDIAFIGTYDHSRQKYLEPLGWERLHVWGDGWKRYRNFNQHASSIVPHAVYYPLFADIISHSKCSLGLLRDEAEDLHTQRTIEIPACGGFQIAPRNEEILSLFEENHEIVCFSSPEELQDKVNYYLEHDKERNSIAQQGLERVTTSGHTYMDRVRTMLDLIR